MCPFSCFLFSVILNVLTPWVNQMHRKFHFQFPPHSQRNQKLFILLWRQIGNAGNIFSFFHDLPLFLRNF